VKNMATQRKDARLLLVALGANVSVNEESLEQTLARAIKAMAESGFAIRAISRFYRTPCFPEGAGPDYVNAAIAVRSALSPSQVLERLHTIEAQFGRERVQRWGQRTLDLDLIGMEDVVLPDVTQFHQWRSLDPALQAKTAPDRLILPHPRLQDRAFVLVPLVDIARHWRHPVLGETLDQLLARLPKQDIAQVTPL
jgi:2-amino-4-hydroxy-6-hydroxymethyldihydropteridine diphosphokinase